MATPIALSIAGSDPSGGAGIQADLKTFSALGVYGAAAVTSLTAQNTLGVTGIHQVPAAFISAQIDSVLSDLAVGAVKIGMVGAQDAIAAIVQSLSARPLQNVVVDPVMIATSGDRLLAPGAIAALRNDLLPLACIVTPNLPEAAELLGEAVATDEDSIVAQGQRILGFGSSAVLVKGGHGVGAESIDYLVTPYAVVRFAAKRIATKNTHGTGCSLSSAIAAGLAKGEDIAVAVGQAKDFVNAAIAAADRLQIGHGNGPIHHFHRFG
ncbi:MAG: bifunctional hydroxymethylpyrimidine kinase/phosphomethylpyrimidine kinase [Xanthobacteraceae bacterium]|nr:bifunctional hydroxymethylpyrimidine kinase/phosphomethylpyrimidine kinase [Xanthobacteraceae bacterium]